MYMQPVCQRTGSGRMPSHCERETDVPEAEKGDNRDKMTRTRRTIAYHLLIIQEKEELRQYGAICDSITQTQDRHIRGVRADVIDFVVASP